MAEQLKSSYIGEVSGVRTTPVILIEVPYDSINIDAPVTGVLRGIGSSNVSGTIRRVFFILPIIWYGDGSVAVSLPTEGDALDYTSNAYSHLEISDTITGGQLATFNITLNPQIGSGYLSVDVTAPDTGSDWSFSAYMDIFKEE